MLIYMAMTPKAILAKVMAFGSMCDKFRSLNLDFGTSITPANNGNISYDND